MTIAGRKSVKILLAKNVPKTPIPIQHHAMRLILGVAHHCPEYLVDRRYAATRTNHKELLDFPLYTIDAASPTAKVLEPPNRPLKVNAMPNWQRIQRFCHLPALPLFRVKVHLYQDIQVTLRRLLADRRVAADDRFASDGITQTHHQMTTCRETEYLIVVFEFEGEDARVPGNGCLAVEGSPGPNFRIEEDWAWDIQLVELHFTCGEHFAGCFV